MFEGCFDPDWSSAKAGAKAQVVPDHAAALCPSKYPSCSTKGRGECPCAGWSAWTEGTWQLQSWVGGDPSLCTGQRNPSNTQIPQSIIMPL